MILRAKLIGKHGRFGNALFQYAACKKLAELWNLKLEVPADWNGRLIFDIPEPTISFKDDEVNVFYPMGYFINKEITQMLTKEWCQKIFKFRDKWLKRYPKEGFYVAAHLRRGDYASNPTFAAKYCTVDTGSYEKAIVKAGYNPEKVVWVTQESEHSPPRDELEIPFLKDFLMLVNADVLFRANSSFSFWAGVLGNGEVYSPRIKSAFQFDTEFEQGNHCSICEDEDDFFLV